MAVAVLLRNLRIDANRRSSKWNVRAILETCAFIESQMIYIHIYIYMTIGVLVRMSILDTKVAGLNLSINIFSP